MIKGALMFDEDFEQKYYVIFAFIKGYLLIQYIFF